MTGESKKAPTHVTGGYTHSTSGALEERKGSNGAAFSSVQDAPTPEKFTSWVFGSADTEIDIAGVETITAPETDVYTMEWASLVLVLNITTSTDISVTAELVTDGSTSLNYGVTTIMANKAAGLHYASLSAIPYGHTILLKAINNDATAGTIKGALISREQLA